VSRGEPAGKAADSGHDDGACRNDERLIQRAGDDLLADKIVEAARAGQDDASGNDRATLDQDALEEALR
jgi:hypothetical protein